MERDIIRLEAELMVLGPPPLPMEISKYSAVSIIPQLRQNITPLMWLRIIMISPGLCSSTVSRAETKYQTNLSPSLPLFVLISHRKPAGSWIDTSPLQSRMYLNIKSLHYILLHFSLELSQLIRILHLWSHGEFYKERCIYWNWPFPSTFIYYFYLQPLQYLI